MRRGIRVYRKGTVHRLLALQFTCLRFAMIDIYTPWLVGWLGEQAKRSGDCDFSPLIAINHDIDSLPVQRPMESPPPPSKQSIHVGDAQAMSHQHRASVRLWPRIHGVVMRIFSPAGTEKAAKHDAAPPGEAFLYS